MSYHKNTPHYTDPDTGTSYAAIIDKVSGAAVNIDFAHHELHEGDHYAIKNVVDLSLNNVFDLRVKTPNTAKWAHLTVMLMTEVETEFYLYENVTLTTSGTAASSYNRNRNSTNTAGIILSTVTSAATSTANTLTGLTSASALSHGYMGSGFIDGGQTDTRMEWILKQNTAYSLRIIATAAGYTDYLLDWYEHTNEY